MKAKKSFSQNFITDLRVPAAIAAAIPLAAGQPNWLLEVGAGQGALTLPLITVLSPQDTLVAVEVDPACLKTLNIVLAPYPTVRLLGQNIMGVWPETVVDDTETKIHVVGNLPYHMTGQILFHFCGEMADLAPRWRDRVASFTLMVQHEVAERLMAPPGNSAINPLTWSIQTWFEVKPILKVPPTAFRPRPKVNSMVIQLIPRAKPLFDTAVMATAARLIQASFKQPRKTLRNNWIAAFGQPALGHAIWQVIPTACANFRPHTVTLADWQTWATALHTAQQQTV